MPQLILSFVYNIINKEQGFAIIIRKQNKNDQKTHWLVIPMQKNNNNKIAFAWIFFFGPCLEKIRGTESTTRWIPQRNVNRSADTKLSNKGSKYNNILKVEERYS